MKGNKGRGGLRPGAGRPKGSTKNDGEYKSGRLVLSCLESEAAAIRARARALGLSVSRYLVSLAVEEIRKQEGQ